MRLFIAIPLPPNVCEFLGELQRSLRPILPDRFGPELHPHITLKFIGETPEPDLPGILEALKTIGFEEPLLLQPGPLACFPMRGPVRVIAQDVRDAEGRCVELQSRIEAATCAAGIPRDARSFRPHITLGRLKDRAGRDPRTPIAEWSKTLQPGPSLHADRFVLMESRLSRAGREYLPLATFPG